MVLPSWKDLKPGSPRIRRDAEPADPEPEVPAPDESVWRRSYAHRDEIPDTSVTRQICASVHDRPHRLKQMKALLGRMEDQARGRRRQRRIPQLGPYAGEYLARLALREVLFADKRPVPSFGFQLAPVLSHCVAARRQWRLRAALLVVVVGLTALRYPWGAGILVAAALLHMSLRGGRVGRILRWGTTSLVSFILLGLAVFAVYRLAGTYAPVLREALRQGAREAVLLALAVTAVYVLDRWVAWAYVLAVRPGRRTIGDRPHAAPVSARKTAAIKVTETWQSVAYTNYGSEYRFVGAGIPWDKTSSRIRLKAAGGDDEDDGKNQDHEELEGLREFEADELMDDVRDELERLRDVLVETHSLPNCDVSEMLGVPETEWKNLPVGLQKVWPEVGDMVRGARGAPSSTATRRYLTAQVISWDGQIVVTIFAHAALEGRMLHFVTRPHYLAPLRKDTAVAARGGWALASDLLLVPLHAVGDTVDLAIWAYGTVRRSLPLDRTGRGTVVNQGSVSAGTVGATGDVDDDDEKKPVSLREYCQRTSVEDMHQWEDALRHAHTLQVWMFARVRYFLDEHGADLVDFDKQVSNVFNTTYVTGDNNKVMTSAAGRDSKQTGSQKAPAEPKGKG